MTFWMILSLSLGVVLLLELVGIGFLVAIIAKESCLNKELRTANDILHPKVVAQSHLLEATRCALNIQGDAVLRLQNTSFINAILNRPRKLNDFGEGWWKDGAVAIQQRCQGAFSGVEAITEMAVIMDELKSVDQIEQLEEL